MRLGAVERHLGMSRPAARGIVSGMMRLLNVEGYAVLLLDDATDTLSLNEPLLVQQFGLDRGSSR